MPRKPTADIVVLESPSEPEKPQTLYLLAKSAMESEDDMDAAFAAMWAMVSVDPDLVQEAAQAKCRDTLRNVHHTQRQQAWRDSERAISTPTPNKPPSIEGLQRLAEQNLLDFPLPGGLPLRAAFPEDLRSAITRYRAQAKGSILSAHWLGLVLSRTPHDTPVGAVLQHGDLLRLMLEAREFVEGAAPEAVIANSAAHAPERSAA